MPIHESKHCKRCDTTKHCDEFYRRRKGTDLSPYCKSCTCNQTVERQRRFKRQCIEYKGGACVVCGYDRCDGALDFHHLDPTQKDFSIAQVKLTKFGDHIKEELDKCALLCSNCHREAHWEPRKFTNLTDGIRPKKVHYCKDCNSAVASPKAERCVKCSFRAREAIEWPSTAILIEMTLSSSYSAVARELGVSDNAIRKRIKNH